VVESGGYELFMGEYHHNIDDKSRLVLPSKFRNLLGSNFIVTRGFEKCLYVYSIAEWEKLENQLKTLPFTKKDARTINRFFFSGATECEFDSQGRTCLTSPLVSYADLTRECVVIGANDRIEIWDKTLWEAFMTDNNDKMSDLAENLFMDVNF